MSAQLLILLTDVNGVYDRPPSDPSAKLIDIFVNSTEFKVGDKSLQGRGGMGAKVNAALSAVEGGVQAVIIAAGGDTGVIDRIMGGEQAGTLFLMHNDAAIAAGEAAARATAAADIGGHQNGSAANAAGSGSNPAAAAADLEHRAEEIAAGARAGSRKLQALSTAEREAVLHAVADALQAREQEILEVNALDVAIAENR
jgi:delta-1-pyrroline-5-carboxylate synthetase